MFHMLSISKISSLFDNLDLILVSRDGNLLSRKSKICECLRV
ncbi:hypothetical protein ACPF04_01575 [Campylobacter sp. MOP51]